MTFKPQQRKVFLVPDSVLSMAAIQCKIKSDGEAQVRISDCNNTIKLWNNLNNPEEISEMRLKIKTLKEELTIFESVLEDALQQHLESKI